jgi:hypothetical protein
MERIERESFGFFCPDLADVFVEHAPLEGLATLVRHASNIFWNSEDVFLQHRTGTIDQFAFESDVAILRKFLQNPAYRVGWLFDRDFATGEFQAFVDKLVFETKAVRFRGPATTWKSLLTAELANAT